MSDFNDLISKLAGETGASEAEVVGAVEADSLAELAGGLEGGLLTYKANEIFQDLRKLVRSIDNSAFDDFTYRFRGRHDPIHGVAPRGGKRSSARLGFTDMPVGEPRQRRLPRDTLPPDEPDDDPARLREIEVPGSLPPPGLSAIGLVGAGVAGAASAAVGKIGDPKIKVKQPHRPPATRPRPGSPPVDPPVGEVKQPHQPPAGRGLPGTPAGSPPVGEVKQPHQPPAERPPPGTSAAIEDPVFKVVKNGKTIHMKRSDILSFNAQHAIPRHIWKPTGASYNFVDFIQTTNAMAREQANMYV